MTSLEYERDVNKFSDVSQSIKITLTFFSNHDSLLGDKNIFYNISLFMIKLFFNKRVLYSSKTISNKYSLCVKLILHIFPMYLTSAIDHAI